MPEYGWAYVNLDALDKLNGATGSITFRTTETDISGTSAFIYATASHKVGLGINTPGATGGVVGTLPSFILDVSASAGDTTAVRMVGDLQVTGSAHVSGTLTVNSLHANTVISSSNLVVRDPIIGMGFGKGGAETGSVGDRGLVLGLAGNNNQAFLWDQTSGSFVLGKVGSAGADQSAYDIPNGNLSTLRLGDLTASNSISASVFYGNGEHLTGITPPAVTSYTNASDNRILTSVNSTTINAESGLTFDGSTLKVVGATSGSGTFHSVGAATFGATLAVTGSTTLQAATATTISASSTLQAVGVTTLGNNLLVSGTIKAPSLGAGTDDTVVILDSSGFLRTDEADSRIFGSTLVDGNGSSGQITLWNDTNTVQGSTSITYDGSTFKVDDAISGSGTIHAVGAATFGSTLAVTGSSTLKGTTVTTLSASSTLEAVGAAVFGGNVDVSGNLYTAGDLLVARKIIHKGDADTFIDFTTDDINFTVGNVNFLDLTEDTQNEITINETGVDIDFRVEGTSEQGLLYTDASANLVGIRSRTPTAVLHLSESGASVVGMPKPMLRIDHPGDASGKEFTEALFCVTGSIPDDYFEAFVGINTKTPEGALHVKSREGENALVVREGKVVIGNNSAASKFHIRQSMGGTGDRDVMRVETILNSDDTVHNLFYVTGSGASTDGTGVFGSFNTGSVLAVSGTSFMTSMHVQYSGTNQDTNVGPRDYIFGVDTSANSPKIFLESAATAGKGRKIVVKDTGNNAGSNNIKITGSTAGDLIEYGVEALVTSNKGSKTLVSDGVSKWFVIGDV